MQFRTLLAAAGIFAATVVAASAQDITGAGASFPFPVYAKWAEAYKAATGTTVNYQSIGSGGGIRQIKARTVDFGATDAPLKAAELDTDKLVQFPTVLGGVVPVVNIAGVEAGQIKMTGEVLADMFAGTIKKWSDPKIAELNPGVKLPDANITPVYRSDASGTTSIFTTYLSELSPKFKTDLGMGTTVNWPVGQGGKGNEGVAATVKQVPNSIGYVEYAYAKQNKLAHTAMRNKAGKFVNPDAAGFEAAAVGADWSSQPGFGISLTNQPGDMSWPITAPTFVLIPKDAKDPAKTAAVIKFFEWGYKNGAKLALDLDYVALPEKVAADVRAKAFGGARTQ